VCTLLAQWHQATVLHVRCLEHGELIHVTPGGPRLPGDRVASHPGAPVEHDHCAVYPRAHDGTARLAAPVLAALPDVVPAPPPAPGPTVHVVRDPLHHAPKTSPPASRASLV
jgi:hypothetical protein